MRTAGAAGGLALLWLLPGLFGHDPWKPDEAYTFGLVLHILQSGDWVVPMLAGEPFVEKPPIYFLTAALFAWLFDGLLPLHDAARLATAFYMALTFLFLGLAARGVHGRDAAPVAVLLLAGSIGLVDRGHQLITDTAQLAGFALAAYGFVLTLGKPLAGGLVLGTGAGLAFMAKGLFGPGCLAVVALALPAVSPAWRTARYGQAALVAALAALPWLAIWPLALHARAPELLHEWLWGMNVGNFTGERSLAAKPSALYYIWVLSWFALPSWPFAACAVWRARRALRSRADVTLCMVLLAVLLTVLSISKTGRELYAMPALIPLCLLAAPEVSRLAGGTENVAWRTGLVMLAAAGVATWLTWASVDLGVIGSLQELLLHYQPGYPPQLRPWTALLALAYTSAVLYAVHAWRREPARAAAAWTGAIALAWGLSMILLVRYLDTGKSYRSTIAELALALPASRVCIASRDLGEPQRALLHYFAGIITFREESPRRRPDCDLLLAQGARGRMRDPDGWLPIWEGSRPGDDRELFRLYRHSSSTAGD